MNRPAHIPTEAILRGALAAIIADPDCCAASKAIARGALRYHANSGDADAGVMLRNLAKALEATAKQSAEVARTKGGLAGMVDAAEAGAIFKVAQHIWNASQSATWLAPSNNCLQTFSGQTPASPVIAPDPELLEALEALEAANDALCSKRSEEAYLHLIDVDKAHAELLSLDEARSTARAAIAKARGDA